MTTPDFSDFQRPVAPVQRDVSLGTLTVPAAGNPFPIINQDVRQYQSISIASQPQPGNTGVMWLEVLWVDDNNQTMDTDYLTFCPGSEMGAAGGLVWWTLPVKSENVFISGHGDGAGDPVVLTAIASTRAIAAPRLKANAGNFGRLWVFQDAISIPATSSAGPFYFGPVSRAVSVLTETNNTAVQTVVQGYEHQSTIGWQDRANFLSVTPAVSQDLALPETAMRVTLTNTGASAHTVTLTVWDVS